MLQHPPGLSAASLVLKRGSVLVPCLGRRHTSTVAVSGHQAPLDGLLSRRWMLERPDTIMKHYTVSNAPPATLSVIHDDLLHPVLGGNKLRKLDALLPALKTSGVTNVVTCGGLQSAHTAAIAAACAEQGLQSHLLVRGERPEIPTGYHLLTRMYGDVTYVPRSEYANREAMLKTHTARIQAKLPPEAKVGVIEEGAASPLACLGLIRLVAYLAETWASEDKSVSIVTDCGTGTTAIGLAMGIALLDLPWSVTGVMLADGQEYHTRQQHNLAQVFSADLLQGDLEALHRKLNQLPLEWVERLHPRKFGSVLPGEIAMCRQVARETGVLLDPVYSLAAWEMAVQQAQAEGAKAAGMGSRVCMLHCGGMHGLYGLAQRYPAEF